MTEQPGQVGSRRIYTGRVVNLDIDQVRFPDGAVGELEVIRHSGASAVIPFLTDPAGPDPRVLLIRQYRYAADGFVYEIPAGRLEEGELPEACAMRELREETGYRAAQLEHLITFFTTPGFTDERIHVFMASGLTAGDAAREPDEFVEADPMPLSRALELVRANEIVDAKTALGLLYATRFRLPGR